MDFSKLLHRIVRFDTQISLSYYMDLSKLVYGFFCVGIWICKGCYMYLSKLLNVFVKWPMVVVEVGIIL